MALVFITGGSRSGKSFAAQRLASDAHRGREVVVAVFGRETDPEMVRRVAGHRVSRPDGFRTLEVSDPAGWIGKVPDESLLLIDCLGTALGLVMDVRWPSEAGGLAEADPEALPPGYADAVEDDFESLVIGILQRAGDTIVVSNEVGSGLVSAWASGRLFADILGAANRRLSSSSDAAYLAICGRLLDLSRFPETINWPDD